MSLSWEMYSVCSRQVWCDHQKWYTTAKSPRSAAAAENWSRAPKGPKTYTTTINPDHSNDGSLITLVCYFT